jgi:hypothetical protein
MTPDKEPFHISPGRFKAAVDATWPGRWQEMNISEFKSYSAGLELPGESQYKMDLYPEGDAVGTDGTWPQAVRTAVWVRSLIPADYPGRVWLMDEAFDGHAELPAGVTAEQVVAGWLDHEVHGYPEDGS